MSHQQLKNAKVAPVDTKWIDKHSGREGASADEIASRGAGI